MPYIPKERRATFDSLAVELGARITDPGELNYVVSRILDRVVAQAAVRPSYEIMSRYNAAVRDASTEFYRRMMAPYEDKRLCQHGDVYEYMNEAQRKRRED